MGKNAYFVSHKKSKLKENGGPKLPVASALVEGEIAINFGKDVETLSIKNESGDVVTFSSDNYYTEKKLGSGFTGENSGVTVTEALENIEITVDQDFSNSASTNPISTKAVYSAMTDNELVWANAFVAMSGTVSAHTANTEIHVTAADKTAWNAKLDAADVEGFFGAVNYDSTSKRINFYNTSTGGTVLGYIDATDFIKDGMVSNVEIKDVTSGGSQVTCLVISFNTDAGKQDINIPLTDIFDASNYYTKSQTSGATELSTAFDAIDDLVGSGFTSSSITEVIIENEKIVSAALNDLDDKKLDVSAYTPSVELWDSGTGLNSVVLKGSSGTASGDYSVAMGSGTTASGGYSVAEGLSTSATSNYSHAEGVGTTASGDWGSHAEGIGTQASGQSSHAEGENTTASGNYGSHAEGQATIASGEASHAEGSQTTASGDYSHAEGIWTIASGSNSHAEGSSTTASGSNSHAEGAETQANGSCSHAEGASTIASGNYSHTEGYNTKASGSLSHAEGRSTIASGDYSHAEGEDTTANGNRSHAEGYSTVANNQSEHASGQYNVSLSASTTFGNSGNTLFSVGNGTGDNARHNAFEIRQNGDIYISSGGTDIKLQDNLGADLSNYYTKTEVDARNLWVSGTGENAIVQKGGGNTASGNYSVAEGHATASGDTSHAEGGGQALGSFSHAEGRGTASGDTSHAEGTGTQANGQYSHAEGYQAKASGSTSHAEGYNTTAGGNYSHAEGYHTIASGQSSHAEGNQSRANGDYSHAEGISTANGDYSHTEGDGSIAEGYASHAEGESTANGYESHAEGYSTANGEASHAEGWSNAEGDYSHAEGEATTASGMASHSEGHYCSANGDYSHAEGGYENEYHQHYSSTANGKASHAEGVSRTFGDYSHSEGLETVASGESSHAEGEETIASGQSSHAEGYNSKANGIRSHAEGNYAIANGDYSHAEGSYTQTKNLAEHTSGQYNISSSASTTFGDSGNTLFSVGNGTAENARHNAFEIKQNGDIYITSGSSDIKLQDYIGSVETVTAITPSNSGSTDPIATKVVAENELTISTALTDLNTNKADKSDLGGLKLVKVTQAEYDALTTKDPNTLYVIVN